MIGRDEWDAGAPRRDQCAPRGCPASCMNDRNAFAPYQRSEPPGVPCQNERILRCQRQDDVFCARGFERLDQLAAFGSDDGAMPCLYERRCNLQAAEFGAARPHARNDLQHGQRFGHVRLIAFEGFGEVGYDVTEGSIRCRKPNRKRWSSVPARQPATSPIGLDKNRKTISRASSGYPDLCRTWPRRRRLRSQIGRRRTACLRRDLIIRVTANPEAHSPMERLAAGWKKRTPSSRASRLGPADHHRLEHGRPYCTSPTCASCCAKTHQRHTASRRWFSSLLRGT